MDCEFASQEPYVHFAIFATDILTFASRSVILFTLLPPRHDGSLLAGHGLVAKRRVRRVWVGAREIIALLGFLFPHVGQQQLLLPVPIIVVDVAAHTACDSLLLLLLLLLLVLLWWRKVLARFVVWGQTGRADGLAGVVMARAGLWAAGVGGVKASFSVELVLLDLVRERFLVVLLMLWWSMMMMMMGSCGGGAFFVLFGGDRVGGVVDGVDGRGLWVEDVFDGIHVWLVGWLVLAWIWWRRCYSVNGDDVLNRSGNEEQCMYVRVCSYPQRNAMGWEDD